eukprot:TRINITY_DN2417_c0_g1_i1.p1 TRINITY_DN2417_c0_g1~~TRINITY_DN2417_c0_g1_i1.p1  ORF type:complete len:305 (-),score=108.72 TRINITY_DN2417_c0_g1_i1:137-1051(-)
MSKKWTLNFEERPEDIQVSLDGKHLLIGTNHIAGSTWAGCVHVANLEEETPKFVREIECRSGVNSVAWLKEKLNSSFAIGNDDGNIFLFKSSTGKKDNNSPFKTLSGHDDLVSSVAVLGEDSLVSSSFDKSVKVWNYNSNSSTADRTLEGHLGAVTHVASSSSDTFTSVSKDKTAKFWDRRTTNGTPTNSLSFSETLHSVSFQDQNVMAICGEGSLLSVYDVRNLNECLYSHSIPNTRSFRNLTFSNGKIAAGHDDFNVYLFDFEKKSLEKKWKAHEGSVRSLASKSELLITSGWDKTVSAFSL